MTKTMNSKTPAGDAVTKTYSAVGRLFESANLPAIADRLWTEAPNLADKVQTAAKEFSFEDVKDRVAEAPKKAKELYAKVKNDSPSSETAAKVSLTAGLGSLIAGAPASVIAIASALLLEDRNRIVAKGLLKKVAEKRLAPTAKQLKFSRIGLLTGMLSLAISGMVLAKKRLKAKEAKAEARRDILNTESHIASDPRD